VEGSMPLPKSTPKKEKSKARLQRYHARKAAEKYWGKESLIGNQKPNTGVDMVAAIKEAIRMKRATIGDNSNTS